MLENLEVKTVKQIASQLYRHYFPTGGDHALVTRQDFTGYGMIGLFDAKKYDAAMAVPFLAYAKIRIRGEIIDQMRKQFGPVPIPAEKEDSSNSFPLSEKIWRRKESRQMHRLWPGYLAGKRKRSWLLKH